MDYVVALVRFWAAVGATQAVEAGEAAAVGAEQQEGGSAQNQTIAGVCAQQDGDGGRDQNQTTNHTGERTSKHLAAVGATETAPILRHAIQAAEAGIDRHTGKKQHI